jgi:hypothetical protein
MSYQKMGQDLSPQPMAMGDSYDRRMQIDAYFASLGRGMSFFYLLVISLLVDLDDNTRELIAVLLTLLYHYQP